MSDTKFSSVKLNTELLNNLDSLDYHQMTAIQAQSLPHILDGKDVIAQAKTGSGKTAAFGLGILQQLDVRQFNVQALILCPTRELADQVAKEIRKLARGIQNIKVLTLCGGKPFGPQTGSLEHGAHIVVGTPGRIEEHLRKGTLKLNKLNMFILDEADRMLDLGFEKSMQAIVEHTPETRQTLLFSATFPQQIQSISDKIMQKPISVRVETQTANENIAQIFYQVSDSTPRIDALRILLLQKQLNSTVVFCNTKKETLEIAHELNASGFSAVALNGDLDQKNRDQILVRFSNKSVSILVATDVAARGLDIDSLDAVINYQMSREMEVHVHRIGRTGRAGNKGLAMTLFGERETGKLDRLSEYLQSTLNIEPLPSINYLDKKPNYPGMVTLQIDGGKKQKVRPGDILGALTGENGIDGNQVGKINIFDNCAFVAVAQASAKAALNKLTDGKLKGRSFKIRRLRG